MNNRIFFYRDVSITYWCSVDSFASWKSDDVCLYPFGEIFICFLSHKHRRKKYIQSKVKTFLRQLSPLEYFPSPPFPVTSLKGFIFLLTFCIRDKSRREDKSPQNEIKANRVLNTSLLWPKSEKSGLALDHMRVHVYFYKVEWGESKRHPWRPLI